MKDRSIRYGQVKTAADLDAFMQEVLRGYEYEEPILVKPNWANALPVSEPHFQALLHVLDCLDSHTVSVVESYSAWRNQEYREYFLETHDLYWEEKVTPENGKDMWKWLKDQDEWFLQTFGFFHYFSNHQISYINCTEEVWKDRVTPPDNIREELGERCDLVENQNMVHMIPISLWDLRGHILINFTKIYDTGIYAAKNLMGLIPEPNRTYYHGKNDALLLSSIYDINIIYRSLFQVIDVVESLQQYQLIMSASNPAQLDEVGCLVLESGLQDAYHDVEKARALFGSYPALSPADISSFVQEAIKGHAGQ